MEGPACTTKPPGFQLCHPDRSAAQWRDLLFTASLVLTQTLRPVRCMSQTSRLYQGQKGMRESMVLYQGPTFSRAVNACMYFGCRVCVRTSDAVEQQVPPLRYAAVGMTRLLQLSRTKPPGSQLCHPGRSVAQWRDLLARLNLQGSSFVIPTEAQRSGGTCCSTASLVLTQTLRPVRCMSQTSRL